MPITIAVVEDDVSIRTMLDYYFRSMQYEVAAFNSGEDFRVAILSVPEGDDKVEKYPLMFATTDALVMNKYDMKPYFEFDDARVERNTTDINPNAKVFRVSNRTGDGVEEFMGWLREKINAKISK